MATSYISRCNSCGYEVKTEGHYEFYRDEKGEVKLYGHPVPFSDEARQRGIYGYYSYLYCGICDKVQKIIIKEFKTPHYNEWGKRYRSFPVRSKSIKAAVFIMILWIDDLKSRLLKLIFDSDSKNNSGISRHSLYESFIRLIICIMEFIIYSKDENVGITIRNIAGIEILKEYQKEHSIQCPECKNTDLLFNTTESGIFTNKKCPRCKNGIFQSEELWIS